MGTDSTDKFLRKVIYYVDLIHCLSLYSLTNGYEVLTTQNNKHLLQFIFYLYICGSAGAVQFQNSGSPVTWSGSAPGVSFWTCY